MLIGKCSACGGEATFPSHFGGFTLRCKMCSDGWVLVPRSPAVAPEPTAPAVRQPVINTPAKPPTPRVPDPPRPPAINLPKTAPVKPVSVTAGPVPGDETACQPARPSTNFFLEGSTPSGGVSRIAGIGCIILAVPLLMAAVLVTIGTLAAGRDDAESLGEVCGAFLFGLAVLGVGVYLLRRDA